MPHIELEDDDRVKLTVHTDNMYKVMEERLEALGNSVLGIYSASKMYVRRCQQNFQLGPERTAKARWPAVSPLVKRYFGRTPAEMTQDQRSTMRIVLMKTLAGLQRDLTVVVDPDLDAAGMVKANIYTGDMPKNPLQKARFLNQKGIKPSMAPPSWQDGKFKQEFIESRGNIRINLQWVDPQAKSYDKVHSCVTLIHEATHKFANTWDYCYFEHGGGKAKTPEPGRFDATDKNNRFAHHGAMDAMTSHFVGNADSYGYFIYFAGQNLS
jgi:hypothetical protein